jgi:hypothetical protein
MSLTSYRAAPPRAKEGTPLWGRGVLFCEWVRYVWAPATKPGGVLLFHRLSDSTIGAVWFHVRVRDGIGWVTDAMATKLCGRRAVYRSRNRAYYAVLSYPLSLSGFRPVIDGGALQARIEQLGPVSSMRYRTSTSGLSRSWSSTALRNLISREASRLDAFSGYPVHT